MPESPPYQILPGFERFDQRDDIFCRSFWDPEIRSAKTDRFYATYRQTLDNWRDTDGFTQRDYALRNASWHVTDLFAELKEDEDRREGYLDEFTVLREGPDERAVFESTAAATAEIKRVGRLFGADLIGITAYDERWVYTRKYSREREDSKPNEMPAGLRHVIVVAKEMDHGLLDTVPSALSGAATGWGYSQDTVTLLALAQYLRNLGYQAVANLNDTALAIPLAIQAGLGEYGRHGLLITPEYGPRVRLGKIFTDVPLDNDAPIEFGVKEFCAACDRCAAACPVDAITHEAPSDQVHSRSNIRGVVKWTTNAEKCFGFWANQNSECSICVRVCPYNRPTRGWRYGLWRRLAGTSLRHLLLAWDRLRDFGRRQPAHSWWRAARGD